ncbi:MAG: RecQ family zinc-binding domain-containing protein, partial [Bacteroidales bacterium]|nr:RecQ family zinc-binding domain-containing protein [Bacteroidales bacterium]
IHIDIPDCIEAYFQEAGRAGRDEKLAYAVLLYNDDDIYKIKQQYELAHPSLSYIRTIYDALCNYCKIPVGAGEDSVHTFVLDTFAEAYRQKAVPLYYVLQLLERYGLLMYTPPGAFRSRVHIAVSSEDLYRFQVKASKYEWFLTMLLRKFPGIASEFVDIHEETIARIAHVDTDTVVRYLQELHEQYILVYNRAEETHSQIVFTSPRVHTDRLPINEDLYKELKKRAAIREFAMEKYVTDEGICRSQMLLNYFSEYNSQPCGQCDVCKPENEKQKVQRLIALLKEQPRTIADLANKANLPESEVVILLRSLMGQGIVMKEERSGMVCYTGRR